MNTKSNPHSKHNCRGDALLTSLMALVFVGVIGVGVKSIIENQRKSAMRLRVKNIMFNLESEIISWAQDPERYFTKVRDPIDPNTFSLGNLILVDKDGDTDTLDDVPCQRLIGGGAVSFFQPSAIDPDDCSARAPNSAAIRLNYNWNTRSLVYQLFYFGDRIKVAPYPNAAGPTTFSLNLPGQITDKLCGTNGNGPYFLGLKADGTPECAGIAISAPGTSNSSVNFNCPTGSALVSYPTRFSGTPLRLLSNANCVRLGIRNADKYPRHFTRLLPQGPPNGDIIVTEAQDPFEALGSFKP